MATRITLRQVSLCPQTDGNGDQSVVVPHIESGWCQVVKSEYVGGGGSQRWLVDVITFEPVQDDPSSPK